MRPAAGSKLRRKAYRPETLGVQVGRFKKAVKRLTGNVWQHILDSFESLALSSCSSSCSETKVILPYHFLRERAADLDDTEENEGSLSFSSLNPSSLCVPFSHNFREGKAQSELTQEEGILLKLSVLGDSEAGKTSFVKKYVYAKASEDYVPTVGIVSMEKVYSIRNVKISLQIWDMGGNLRSSDIMALVCKDASAFLFMFDLTRRSSLQSVKDWFVQARQWNKKAIHVMIGTKYDHFIHFPNDIQQAVIKQARHYAQAMAASLFFSSVSHNINVQKVFKVIVARLFDLPCNIPRSVKPGEPITEF